MCRYWLNEARGFGGVPYVDDLPRSVRSALEATDAQSFHQSLPKYRPTQLLSLPALAASLNVGAVYIKDESHRFGLKAFKVLGASYAIYRFVSEQFRAVTGNNLSPAQFLDTETTEAIGQMTFCTATDGNHGRAVAWTARQLGQHAVIYIPAESVPARVENIRSEGAEVVLVDGSYDDAVISAAEDSAANGWQVISDTSYDDYNEIPAMIVSGYGTLFDEIDEALKNQNLLPPTVCFVQAGVGALAAAAARHYTAKSQEHRTDLVCVEPLSADCVLQAARANDHTGQTIKNKPESIMAGLNCGRASPLAMPLIRAGFKLFLAVSDDYGRTAMRRLFNPLLNDESIVAGESGAAGLAGLLALCEEKSLAEAKRALSLNSDSRVLLINTEGDTDPGGFRQVIGE